MLPADEPENSIFTLLRAASVDVGQLLIHLERSLDDPSQPRLCPVCARILDAMCATVSEPAVSLLRGRFRHILFAILNFLTAERSEFAIADLTLHVASSMRTCPRQSDKLHFMLSTGFTRTDRLVPDLVGAITSVAENCFSKSIPRAISTHAFRFRRTWPSSAQDLLPNGPSGFRGLLFWVAHSEDAVVLTFFMRIFLWCRTAFYAEFTNSSSSRRLCLAICSRLDSAAARLTANTAQPTSWGYRCEAASGLDCLAQVLDFLVRYCSSEWPGWNSMFCGSEMELLSSTFAAMDACGDKCDQSVKVTLRQFAFEQYSTLDSNAFDTMPEKLVHYVFDEQIRHGGCYGHFRTLLASLLDRHCSGPECPNTETKKLQLFACAACRTTLYCSKTCQSQHWKSALHPHKPLCKLLSGIVAAAPPSLEPGDFAVACRTHGFDVDRLSEIYAIVWEQRLCDLGGDTKDSFAAHLRQMDLLHQLDIELRADRGNWQWARLLNLASRLIELQTERHMLKLLYRYLKNRLGLEVKPL